MAERELDHAGVVAPPPLIYAGTLAVGLLVHFFAPLPFLPNGLNLILGVLLVILGLALAFAAIGAIRRANTPLDPGEPVRAIVSDGPYRFTRNPIYVSFGLIYLGVTCALNALAVLALFPIGLLVIHFGVIAREEKYLERKFGGDYLRYKTEVRRWL